MVFGCGITVFFLQWFGIMSLMAMENTVVKADSAIENDKVAEIPVNTILIAERPGPMSRKELINELQGLKRRASKSIQNFNYRTNKYSLKQILEARRKAERDLNSPIIIPVNPTMIHSSIVNRLALAQLRDCVFIGSSCAGPGNMDAKQSSKYIDQMQAFLSNRNVLSSKKRYNLQ